MNLTVMTGDRPFVIKEAWRRHACVYMNLYGVPLHGSEKLHPNGTNLWEEFQHFKYRFVVDNHSPWERCAKDEAFSDVAFVLATTALNESTRLWTLYEDRHGNKKAFKNVFFFGAEIDDVTELGYIVKGKVWLGRLDQDAISLADKHKLETLGNMNSPLGLKRPKEEPDKELDRLEALRRTGQDALLKEIAEKIPKCFKNYRVCADVLGVAARERARCSTHT